jgi:DNA-binding CsgD family transcriptional regulator/ketosteroid isomerase-like protein
MTPLENPRLAVLARWYAAYDARDIDALCELAHPDILMLPIIPAVPELPGATFSGHEGLRTFMRWSFESFPHVRVESKAFRDLAPSMLASTTHVLDHRSPSSVEIATYTLFDFDGQLVRRLCSFFSESDALAAVAAKPVLTPREREVFQLLAQGLTTPKIADRLFVSPATVRTHVQNGIRRLGAHTKVEAVSMAIQRGEIAPERSDVA